MHGIASLSLSKAMWGCYLMRGCYEGMQKSVLNMQCATE